MPLSRRDFLHATAAGAATATLGSLHALRAADSPNEKIVVGVMGTNGRGTDLARNFAKNSGASVAYVCDVDEANVQRCASAVNEIAGKTPTTVSDFRRILDDKSVDALVIATPDHWHAPATILGCQAQKHVYCEKPASHNAQEGEWMVEAARKHDRVVQLGTQRRSGPAIREAIEKLHAGVIGKVLQARAWYFSPRPGLGRATEVPVPAGLDYALWQGPAPERPYREFRDYRDAKGKNSPAFHYHWHWFWHWGTAELGNNGIHMIDVCRWGLGVEYPKRVSCAGGRYRYQDDQETPDTTLATFDFGDKTITWEARSWYKKRADEPDYETAFYGENGSLVIGGGGYRIYDAAGKEVAKTPGSFSETTHIQNFCDAIRGQAKLNAEIAEGVKSTLLCHLGNIAYRTNRVLEISPETHRPLGLSESEQALWGREYNPKWQPRV